MFLMELRDDDNESKNSFGMLQSMEWPNMQYVPEYVYTHDDVIKLEVSFVAGPLCGEDTGHRWIPPHQGPITQTLLLLCCRSAYAVKQTIEWRVIWD